MRRQPRPSSTMKSTRPSLPMTGGCQCGAIRYEITSFPLLLYTCNCTDCQRQTGSAFALNMPVSSRIFASCRASRMAGITPRPMVRQSSRGSAATAAHASMANATDGLKSSAFVPARSMTRHGCCRSRISSRAARSRGYSQRRARSVSRPSRTVGEACCLDGVPAGPTRPIERREALSPPSPRCRRGMPCAAAA